MIRKMVFVALSVLLVGMSGFASTAIALEDNDIAIQRVINRTRENLSELAGTDLAMNISDLMERLDSQYNTWNDSCGSQYDPQNAEGTCKEMAEQMRETGIELYGALAEYLPNIQNRYEKGLNESYDVILKSDFQGSPRQLFNSFDEAGDSTATFEADSEYFVPGGGEPDPTASLLDQLSEILPDFSNELPAEIVAANTYISMRENAKNAKALAAKFSKAKEYLVAQKEYVRVIENITAGVAALPNIFKIQASNTKLTAKPNQKYIRSRNTTAKKQANQGLAPLE